MKRFLIVAETIAVASASAMATPINFTENWDGYTAGAAPPSPWYTDPHMVNGSNVVTGTAAQVVSVPNAYQVNNSGYAGADRGDQAMLVGASESIEATNAAALHVSYTAKAQTNKNADWYFELSLGDVHAPDLIQWIAAGSVPLATPIPVVAWCKPLPTAVAADFKKVCYYFDGAKWAGAGYFDVNATAETFVMTVDSDGMTIGNAGDGPYHLARAYLGNFDRVSIYTLNFISSTWTTIDDVSITGGNVVPEPASLVLLAIAAPLLRRRRAQ